MGLAAIERSVVAATALKEHGGDELFRVGSPWWCGGDMALELGSQPQCQAVTGQWRELSSTAQELPGPQCESSRQRTDIGHPHPTCKLRREPQAGERAWPGLDPNHVGAGEEVAHPFAAVVEHGHHESQTAGERPQLEEAHQAAYRRVPQPNRAAIIANDLQAERELSQRPAVGEGLHCHRHHHEGEEENHEQQGGGQRRIEAVDSEHPNDRQRGNHQHHTDHDGVDQPSSGTDEHRSGAHLKRNPFAGKDLVGHDRRLACPPGDPHADATLADVDVDVFVVAHEAQWQRLRVLAAQRRLTGGEADELVRLYRQTATHLSLLRSRAPEPGLIDELSVLLVKAKARIARPRNLSWPAVGAFFAQTIPAALYRVRWWSVVVAVACLLIAVVAGVWLVANPELLNSVVPPARQQEIAEEAFASYYSTYPSGSFASLVWTNNSFIAALCVATGITGIYPATVLFENSLSVGVMGAVMHVQNADEVFWTLILPHGLLELSCVFVAGAAGMRLFWAWLVPGARTRATSLAQEGRTTIVVVLAVTIALGVSGIVEGFVTGSQLNPWVKIALGVLAFAAFWVVTFVAGRRAVEAGVDPGLSEEEARNEVAVAA